MRPDVELAEDKRKSSCLGVGLGTDTQELSVCLPLAFLDGADRLVFGDVDAEFFTSKNVVVDFIANV